MKVPMKQMLVGALCVSACCLSSRAAQPAVSAPAARIATPYQMVSMTVDQDHIAQHEAAYAATHKFNRFTDIGRLTLGAAGLAWMAWWMYRQWNGGIFNNALVQETYSLEGRLSALEQLQPKTTSAPQSFIASNWENCKSFASYYGKFMLRETLLGIPQTIAAAATMYAFQSGVSAAANLRNGHESPAEFIQTKTVLLELITAISKQPGLTALDGKRLISEVERFLGYLTFVKNQKAHNLPVQRTIADSIASITERTNQLAATAENGETPFLLAQNLQIEIVLVCRLL